MKHLLYGLQSSGASTYARVLGSFENTITVPDLYADYVAPNIDYPNVVLKAVITTKYDIEDHVKEFKPDKKSLVIRHPICNYVSLKFKPYAGKGGDLKEKFEKMEREFLSKDKYDGILIYEFLVDSEVKMYEKNRIQEFNFDNSEWLKNNFYKWGFGNSQKTFINKDLVVKRFNKEDREVVESWCPNVCAFMDIYYRQNGLSLSA